MIRVASTRPLTERIAAFEIEAPELVASAEPGQIVLARVAPEAPWVPKAIVDVNRDRGTMTLLFSNAPDLAARGTDLDIKGPFGVPGKWDKASKVLFIAEGDGLGAILAPLRQAKEKGRYTIVIAGYRSQNDVFWKDQLNELSDELYVVTDDGSYGIKGPLRHTLRAVCEQSGDVDRVHAAGSLKLLKATADVTRNFNIPATVSLAAVFDDAVPPVVPLTSPDTSPDASPKTPREAALQIAPGADEAFDWAHANDLDAHKTDFDALARRLGILVTR